MADLLVRQLLRGAHQAVARVGDHDVDPVELGPGAINDAPDRRDLGQVELGQPQPVAIYSAFRSFMTERSRKVPAMRSPRASNCSVMMRPKPHAKSVRNSLLSVAISTTTNGCTTRQ